MTAIEELLEEAIAIIAFNQNQWEVVHGSDNPKNPNPYRHLTVWQNNRDFLNKMKEVKRVGDPSGGNAGSED